MKIRLRNYRSVGLLLGFVILALLPVRAYALTKEAKLRIKKIRRLADAFEKKQQWRHAWLAYNSLIKYQRDYPQIREKYIHCLRRFIQDYRHRDASFRKEVLGLKFSQAMNFYEFMANYLLTNSLDHEQLTAKQLFDQGIREFRHALASSRFRQLHLAKISPVVIDEFQAELIKRWGRKQLQTVQQAANAIREVAKAARRKLRLRMTVTVVEFTCGSCYAIDDYTMYLTPRELQRLAQSLKGDIESSVDFEIKENDIGYIKITEFNETTLADVDAALLALTKQDMKALILDVRGNRGGIVDSAIEVVRRFLSSGLIVSIQSANSKTLISYQARNPNALTLPVVVLVDCHTASAAEILVGAMKENGRARIVGQTTYGKGCLQELYRLAPRTGAAYPGGLRLTVARFFSPNGSPYSGKGVIPHVLIDPLELVSSKGTRTVKDPVLKRAREEAEQLLDLP